MNLSKLHLAIIAFLSIGTAFSQVKLQESIDKASPGSEVLIPKGTWKEPLKINKSLKLRGAGAEETLLDISSDSPGIQVESKEEVSLENLTLRWKRESSNRSSTPQSALFVRDTPLKIQNVRFIAPDNHARCPSAVTATGFSEVSITSCEFRGYDFTTQFGEGAKAKIADSVILKPGHCGITAGPNSTVEVLATIISGSDYHALRCTGGELIARHNLVIGNKNRGFYLGNKTARGQIRDNIIQDNGTGISGFAASEVEIAHNFIAGSDFAAIDMRDTCRLKIDHNLILNNSRALVLFKESGVNKNSILQNSLGGNKTDFEGFEPSPGFVKSTTKLDPTGNPSTRSDAGFGLTGAEKLDSVWTRWLELKNRLN